MYLFNVLLVSLTTVVFVCAVKEVKVEQNVSETPKISSTLLKSDLKPNSLDESESKPSLLAIPDKLSSVSKSEIKKDGSRLKKFPTKTGLLSAPADKLTTVITSKNSEGDSFQLKKSPEKLTTTPDKLSTVLTSENSEDDTYRSKKSPYRRARFEQFPQNPQQMQYIHTPAQTTTVCIVVRSSGHNHPVTLCGPQTNQTETTLPEANHLPPPGRQSNQQMTSIPVQQVSSDMNMQQGQSSGMHMEAVPTRSDMHVMKMSSSAGMQQPTKFLNEGIKSPGNIPLSRSALVQQEMFRMPLDSQQKPGNFQYQMVQPSVSGISHPSSINLIQPSSLPQKQYLVSQYPFNQNPNSYSSNSANVITSNVPLSLNCHLQPNGPTNRPISIGHYQTSGHLGHSSDVQSQDLYHKPGDARTTFGPTYSGREIPPPLFLVPDTQRNAGPMYMLPDGSPIEGSNLPLGSVHMDDQHFVRASQDPVKPMQYSSVNQHSETMVPQKNENLNHMMMNNMHDPQNNQGSTISQTMPPSEVQWQQPMGRNSMDSPVQWTGQEQPQVQSWSEQLTRSTPEYITQEYLRQWDDAYHQQIGRSSEGPMDAPSVSYIPFYFHLGESQYRSDDDSNLKATNAEKPLTEEELKKKAMLQEQEINESRKKLEEMRTLLKASEDKLAKVTSETKKKSDEERSVEIPKTEDLDKSRTTDTPVSKKEMQKIQDKRQIKKMYNP